MLSSSILIAALLTVQAASPAPACQLDAAPTQAVRAVAEGIVSADNARDIERVRSFYAADAILLPPNETPVRGWDAIRPRYVTLFEAFAPAIEGHIDEICVNGAVAYVRGRNGGRLVSRGPAPTRPLDDSYLILLRQDQRGAWRISHLMWHPASPPASRH